MHWTVTTEYISHCHTGFFPESAAICYLRFTPSRVSVRALQLASYIKMCRCGRITICRLRCTVHCVSKYHYFVVLYESILDNFWHRCSCVSKQSEDLFPPHLTSASVLPGKIENPEIVSFHLNAACCFTEKTQNALKYHLVTAGPFFTDRMIDCMHLTGPRKRAHHSPVGAYVTLTLDVYQVCHCVGRCGKNGSCSYQA